MTWTRRHSLVALLSAGCAAPALATAYAQTRAAGAKPLPGDYMGAATRAAVERLKAAVAADPTGDGNFKDRVLVLYDWVNAYALRGEPTHPDLPALVAGMNGPAFPTQGERVRHGQFEAFDAHVRTLTALETNPRLVGTLTAASQGPLVVDTHASFRQTYTVGEAMLTPGGGLVVPNHFLFAFAELQTADPKADNYVSANTSRPGVELAAETYPVSGMFSTQLGVSFAQRLFFRIVRGELRRGDTFTVTYGDRSGGSRGLLLAQFSNSAVRFPIWVLTGERGLLLVPREADLPLVGGAAVGVHGFVPSIVGLGEAFDLSVRTEDLYRNRASGGAPAYRLMLDGGTVREIAASDDAITLVKGLRLTRPGVHRFTLVSADGKITGKANPVLAEADPLERVYWGETHGHCGFSEGMGKVDDYYAFARDEARLDFTCLSEHDIWLDAWEWAEMRRSSLRFDRPGAFVTFLGYEWTVQVAYGGHHNVIFRGLGDAQPVTSQRAPTLPDLYRGIRAANAPRDVMIIPHAHMTADATQNDRELEPLVEIVSEHGTFEFLGQRYLANGFQLGFVGASDNHSGHPGYKTRPVGRFYYDGYGGLAAVYASARRRDDLFDAMKDRRTYATNGERIILKARLNGQRMGRIVPLSDRCVVEGAAYGTGPIQSITLVKNGRDLRTLDFDAPSAGLSPEGELIELRFSSISEGKGLAASRTRREWAGQLVVSGAEIVGVTCPEAEALNYLTEWARPSPLDPQAVDFQFKTRGDANAIRLKLKGDLSRVRIRIALSGARTPFDQTTPVPAPGAQAIELTARDEYPGTARTAAGVFDDKIRVRRIRPSDQQDRPFRFEDAARDGDNYYVRIVQSDGGTAWSSPGWIGRVMKHDR